MRLCPGGAVCSCFSFSSPSLPRGHSNTCTQPQDGLRGGRQRDELALARAPANSRASCMRCMFGIIIATTYIRSSTGSSLFPQKAAQGNSVLSDLHMSANGGASSRRAEPVRLAVRQPHREARGRGREGKRRELFRPRKRSREKPREAKREVPRERPRERGQERERGYY